MTIFLDKFTDLTYYRMILHISLTINPSQLHANLIFLPFSFLNPISNKEGTEDHLPVTDKLRNCQLSFLRSLL